MKKHRLAAFCVAMAGLAALPASATITVGTQSTFEDGTTDGWATGGASPNPPVNVPDGGPTGIGDAFLRLVSSGNAGPGGKLVGISGSQWHGDYIAAGIMGIAMDVRNLGATTVSLRVYFDGPDGTAFSADPINLPSGSGWMHVVFPTVPAALVGAVPGSPLAALSNVGDLRLFHNSVAGYPGPNIAAQIGIDNVTAVPEPAAWATLGLGLAVLGAGASMRRARSLQQA